MVVDSTKSEAYDLQHPQVKSIAVSSGGSEFEVSALFLIIMVLDDSSAELQFPHQ